MKKSELIKAVATKTTEAGEKMSQKAVDVVLNSLEEVIKEAMVARDTVKVCGVTFAQKEVPAREGITQLGDHKGEVWKTEPYTKVTVKATKSFADMLR